MLFKLLAEMLLDQNICLMFHFFPPFQVYDGAVYMHQGFSYLVKTLNLSEMVAYCQRADLKYYTKTRDSTTIHLFGGNIVCMFSIQLNFFFLILY